MGGYSLGVDLGTTYSAAAVQRDGQAQIVSLGTRSGAIPSVVYLNDDQTMTTGEAADRRGITRPDRVARGFKRRLGDTTPILLGGSPHSAESLMAKLLRAVVDKVAELEGGPAAHVAVSLPANWGPYKRELLDQAIRLAGLSEVTVLTEPEAAAIHYAATEHLPVGEIVAVYDLGGGTFDAAVLRRTEAGFEILGQPEGIERLGGIDFDAAVFEHVRAALGGRLESLDVDDPAAIAAAARLRQECVDAKEALSADPEVGIPAVLPNVVTEVRLTRPELETMIRPALAETIGSLQRAMESAGVTPEEVSRVLLVGGSSRIPLVAEMVSGAFGRPVAIDAHPKHAVALGAAVAAAAGAVGAPSREAVAEAAVAAEVTERADIAEGPPPEPSPTPPPPPTSMPPTTPPTSKPRRRIVTLGALVVLVLAVAATVFVVRGGDDAAAVCPELTPAELAQATGSEAKAVSGTTGRCAYEAAAVPGAQPDLVSIDTATAVGCDDGAQEAIEGRQASTCRRPGPSSPYYDLTLYFTRDGKAMQATVTTLVVDAQRWVTAFEKVSEAIADPA